jgi:hypothetical protein
MSICTAITSIPLLWNEVISGTSEETATHKVLIWVSLIGDGLVAGGILLEIEKPLDFKKIASFAAVIIGVIASAAATLLLLNFDETVNMRQQKEINTANDRTTIIEQATAWRILNQDISDRLTTSLTIQIKKPIILGYAVGDPESIALASQLFEIFKRANWDVTAVGHWYESQVVPGLRLLGTDEADKAIIRSALAMARLIFIEDPIPTPGMYNGAPSVPDETKLFLYVGTRYPFFRSTHTP